MANTSRFWKPTLLAGVLLAALGAFAHSAEQVAANKPMADTLKEILNRGASLYNNGDRNGAYRLFEGALMALKLQFVDQPELLKRIEDGLRGAEQQGSVGERAWALRETLFDLRKALGGEVIPIPAPTPLPADTAPKAAPAPAPEKKPSVKAPAADAVTGTVTLNGKPLAGAFIRLTSDQGPGKGHSGKTNDDGTFELPDVPPGKYKVSFTTTDPAVTIPGAYRNSAQTPLLIEVTKGGAKMGEIKLDAKAD